MATNTESTELHKIGVTAVKRLGFNIASPLAQEKKVYVARKDGVQCLVRIQTKNFPPKPPKPKQPESLQASVLCKKIDVLQDAKEDNRAKNAYYALIAHDKEANYKHFIVIDADAIDDLVSVRLVSKGREDAKDRKYQFHLKKLADIAARVQQQGKFAYHDQWDANEDIPLATTGTAKLSEQELQRQDADDSGDYFRPGLREGKSTADVNYSEKTGTKDLRHNDMQKKLHEELVAEYSPEQVGCEIRHGDSGFADVVVKRGNTWTIYEIKTANSARLCIRDAMGQLLEYGYWQGGNRDVELVVVGQPELDDAASKYLNRLRTTFNIPIQYRSIALSD